MAGRRVGLRPTIDWQRLALNIRQAGVSLQQASIEMGRKKSWLGQISRGEVIEPAFGDGLALLNYHLDLCGHEKQRELLNV